MNDVASSSGFVQYGDFNINVTARYDMPQTYDQFVAMIEFTMRLWAYVANHIKEGKRTCSKTENAQELAQHPPEYNVPFCTVWGDALHRHGLTVHSHTNPQDALNTFWARYDALNKLGVLNAQTPVTSGNDDTAQVNGGELPDGVIIGKMNPRATKVYYQNEQLVALHIVKWVLTFNKGWIYEAWGTNGNGQYPAFKVYKTKSGSDENSNQYVAVKPFLEGLGLDAEKKNTANGDWWLIGKIAHVTQQDGTVKEYFNPVEVRAK